MSTKSSDTPPPGIPPLDAPLRTPEATKALGGPAIKFPEHIGRPMAAPSPAPRSAHAPQSIGRPGPRLVPSGPPRVHNPTFDGLTPEQIGAQNAIAGLRATLGTVADAIAALDTEDTAALLDRLATDPIGTAQAAVLGFDVPAATKFRTAVLAALDAHKPKQ